MVRAKLSPCYRNAGSDDPPTIASFSGQSRIRVQSTGINDMSTVVASYIFTPSSGDWDFSLCLAKLLSGDTDFTARSPKVDVIVFNNDGGMTQSSVTGNEERPEV